MARMIDEQDVIDEFNNIVRMINDGTPHMFSAPASVDDHKKQAKFIANRRSVKIIEQRLEFLAKKAKDV